MTYEQQLSADCALVENYLKTCFADREPRADLYDAMLYSLLAGGKRIRPVLALESCRMCGGDVESALPLACAVEMVHTYSLIHDDLPCMDDDDLRRGKPTNHKVYGETMAVLAGDALQPAAYTLILDSALPSEARLECARILAEASGPRGMVAGQVLDTLHAPKTEEELTEVHRLKTGCMIRAACTMGCAAGGAAAPLREAAAVYAENLGLAFQIRDDMLDVQGDEATLGKPIGSDARSEKTTFVSLKGMEACEALVREKTEEAKNALRETFADPGFLCWLADELVQREK